MISKKLAANQINRIRVFYLLGQMNTFRLFNTKTNVERFCFAKSRPTVPSGRDGLARSLLHGATHHY